MKTAKLLLTGLLAIFSLAGLTGCQTAKTKVLDPNSDPERVIKGQPYTPPCDGYFVPDSTMLRILDRLSDKDVFGHTNGPSAKADVTGCRLQVAGFEAEAPVVTNLVTQAPKVQPKAAVLPRTVALVWDYPVYTNGLAFEAWESPNLVDWQVLARTNQSPIVVPRKATADFFKLRAYTYAPGFTNYGDFASR